MLTLRIRSALKLSALLALAFLPGCDKSQPFDESLSFKGQVQLDFWISEKFSTEESEIPAEVDIKIHYPGTRLSSTLDFDDGNKITFTPDKTSMVGAPVDIRYGVLNMILCDALGNCRSVGYGNMSQQLPPRDDWPTLKTQRVQRYRHAVVTMEDPSSGEEKLWLIAGNDGSLLNDCWSSADGLNWTPLIRNAPFKARQNHKVVVMKDPGNQYKNTLWLLAGSSSEGALNDIWKTIDGVNWVKVEPTSVFSPRWGFEAVVLDDPENKNIPTIFVFGGRDESTMLSDVWKSADGVIWKQVLAQAPFGARMNAEAVVKDNSIWLVGGMGFTYLNDVWRSTNGKDWQQIKVNAMFDQRACHSLTVFKNSLILSGGENSNFIYNDVWRSSDGVTWEVLYDPERIYYKWRSDHQLNVINSEDEEKLILTGGRYDDILGDVWRSKDGRTFSRGETINFLFN